MPAEVCDIGAVGDFPLGQAVDASVGGRGVIVYHFPPGTVRVWEAVCPHAGMMLSAGDCEGAVCVCPLHGWQFGLRDGQELAGMDGLTEMTSRIEDGRVMVEPVR